MKLKKVYSKVQDGGKDQLKEKNIQWNLEGKQETRITA